MTASSDHQGTADLEFYEICGPDTVWDYADDAYDRMRDQRDDHDLDTAQLPGEDH